MSGLTWLHLSDWHQRGTDFHRKKVHDTLLDDIENRRDIHPDLEKLDFIVFSGDLAFSGKEEEYRAAEENFLEPVLNATEVEKERLFMVPGNHDLDRDTFDLLPADIAKPLIEENKVNEWLEDKERLSLMQRPFKAYSQFIKNFGAGGFTPYAGSSVLEINGKKVALLGFNSALMCGRHRDEMGKIADKGKIIVGEPQVHDTLRAHREADIRIAVLHHPLRWLEENDCNRVEKLIKEGAHFILCGHQHKPLVTNEIGTQGHCVIIPAGASYERPKEGELTYPNAYNFVHLDFAGKKGIVYLRCWSETAGIWREDIDTFKEGKFDFPLPKELSPGNTGRDEDRQEEPKAAPPAPYHPDNPVFNVPFNAKGDGMVGREEALQKVRQQLNAGRRTAIGHTAAFQGLGGLGKAQLAVEYAHRFREEYPLGVIWINADQEIEPQLIKVAKEGQWIHPDSKPAEILELAVRRLKNRSDCLVIFDNVEERAAIEPYLPAVGAQPHLLLTSRAPQPGFIPIDISILDEERSLQLLIKESGRDIASLEEKEQKAAVEIAGKLGGLPLAIEIAGAYLNYFKTCTFQEYLVFLEDNLKEAMKGEMLDSFTGHETDLYLTLRVSKPVLAREPLLNKILEILAWSGTAFMGISLLAALLDKKESELFKPLNLGESLHLLQKAQDGRRYDIHRLLRKVRQEQSPLKNRGEWIKEICQRLGNWFEERRENFTDLPVFEGELDHLKQWLEHVSPLSPLEHARLIWLQAYPPSQWGNFQEFRQLVQSAYSILSKVNEEDLELKANILNDLGFTYSQLGKYKEALGYNIQALEIRQKNFGEPHKDTAFSFENVGIVYGKLGDYNKALEYELQALEIRKKISGEYQPDIARSFDNVGSTYGNLGNYNKALEYQINALKIRMKIFGEPHPNTARSFNNVGETYGELGDYKKALEYKQKALEIRKKIFGENHPDTATSLNNVGITYGDLGEHNKALQYKLRAMEIRIKLFGKNHPGTATSFNHVGITYGDLGEHNKALQYKLRALEIRIKLSGKNHPDTAISLGNVGITYGDLGEHNEALEYQQKALEIHKQLFGEYHPDTATSLNNVGSTYGDLGDHKKALEYQQKALEIYKQLFGKIHLDTAISFHNVGYTYFKIGKPAEALPYFKQSFEIWSKLLGNQHRYTSLAFFYFVYSLIKLKQFQDAKERLDAYLEELPEDHPEYTNISGLKKILLKEQRNSLHKIPKKKKRRK